MGTIFSASDIRGQLGDDDTTELLWNAGKAFAEFLPDEGRIALVTTEPTDDSTAHAFVEGVLLQGRDIVDAGIGDTVTINNALNNDNIVGAVLITHDTVQNLATVTLFDAHGNQLTAETGLTEINELIQSGNFLPAATKGQIIIHDA